MEFEHNHKRIASISIERTQRKQTWQLDCQSNFLGSSNTYIFVICVALQYIVCFLIVGKKHFFFFFFWLCKWKRLLLISLKGFKSQLGKLWWYEGALPPIDYVVKWRTQLWSKASQPMFKGKMSFIESSKVEDSLDGKITIPRVIYMHNFLAALYFCDLSMMYS